MKHKDSTPNSNLTHTLNPLMEYFIFHSRFSVNTYVSQLCFYEYLITSYIFKIFRIKYSYYYNYDLARNRRHVNL